MSIAIPLHLLSAILWVGGMWFAYFILRPVAAGQLEPPQRLTLWVGIFDRFFPLVWISIAMLLGTGYWMIFFIYGGMGSAPIFVHIMQAIGIIMMMIFMHVFFAPFQRLKQAVTIQDWQTGASTLARIRILVGINSLLGFLVIVIASAGRYLPG
jgi:uncharacterized membrane protein